jgi:LEA14-like dessication related protein
MVRDVSRSASRALTLGRRCLLSGVACLALACLKPEAPTVVPRVVRVASVDASGIDFDVELDVHNPNSFPIAAEAVEGTLFVGGERELGRGSANPRASIAAGATGAVSSRVHIDWANIAALAPLLAEERVPYQFRGDVMLGGKTLRLGIPFSLSGELTRSQLLEAGMRGL